MVLIQHITTSATEYCLKDILSTKMERKGSYACIPWRTDTGKEVEAVV
jgi:hypothetical protein